jgi:hypothetical protein
LDGRRGKRGRERKERGEILNEDGREIRWMKEKWKRGKDKLELYFYVCSQQPESLEGK